MTQDYKDLLLDYLTGNLTNTYSTSSAYYSNISYEDVDSSTNEIPKGTIAIPCKDSNGVDNGKTLIYTPTNNELMIVDENLKVLVKYDDWYTDTLFEYFLAIGIDEEGQFYGIDYNSVTDKHRFLLMNNLSEPTKMPNGTLEYRAVLRQSYFINNYTAEDGVGWGYPTYLAKSKQSGTYYFAFTNAIGEILPTKLTINVGAANDWERLPSLDSLILGDQVLDNLIYFDNNDEPVAHYFVQDGVTKDIKRYDCYGSNAITNTTIIDWSTITSSYPEYSNIMAYFKAMDSEHYYLMLSMYRTQSDSMIQKLVVFKNGISANDKLIDESYSTFYSDERHIQILPSLTKNNDLSLFYWVAYYKDSIQYDRLCYNFLPNTERNDSFLYSIYKKNISTRKLMNQYVSFPGVLSTRFNLNKAMYVSPDTGTMYKYTTNTFVYNKDNVNVSAYEDDSGTKNKTLLPNQGLVFDENNNLIFARNLYNLKAFSNKTYSILNIPNNMLNDSTISKNKLISTTNQDIVENDEAITKNIYEDLYINYFNSITMQNRNTTNYINNQEGATRLNLSTSKELDYEKAKVGKMQINYSDGTTLKGGISGTLNNGIVTYEMMFLYPSDKTITTINILSEDEKTIYQTIEMPTLTANKTYRLRQDVHVE